MSLVDAPSTGDLLDVLAKRSVLLERIGDGITDKRALEDELGCSRSTLNRGIRELEEAGLLARPSADLELTLAGEVAVEAFSELWEPLVAAVPLLEHLTDDAQFDVDLLRGATVVESAMPDPDAPVNALATYLDDADHVRATVPTTSWPFARAFADHVDGLEAAEFVFAEPCLEDGATDGECPLAPVVGSEACSTATTDERPPYSLVLFDERRLWLGIYDAQGKIVGAIVNDTTEAVTWAKETYRQLRNDSG